MAIVFVPNIRQTDYKSFQDVVHNAPGSFYEFNFLREKVVANLIRRGDTVENVEVNPQEFKRYCDETNSPNNLGSLDSFAIEKSKGKSY
ncbi:hypothetical protein ACVWWG_007989 [Bradyrhizobium sp. LB7.2]